MALRNLFTVLKGGPRSGNRGHAGRPGKRGGSAPRSGQSIPQNQVTLKYVQEYLNDTYDPGEIKNALDVLTDLVKDSPMVTRVPGASTLMKILEEGRFKNQYETGTSAGIFNPEYRKQAENNAFGDNNFPIYAYIDTTKNGFKPSGVDEYGAITVVFKDTLKTKATATAGDSLEMFRERTATGSPLLKLTEASLDGKVDDLNDSGRVAGYIEAQIHGKVTVKDIKEVILLTNNPTLEIALKAKNIPYKVSQPSEEEEEDFSFGDWRKTMPGYKGN